jgi:ATP synthase protein I
MSNHAPAPDDDQSPATLSFNARLRRARERHGHSEAESEQRSSMGGNASALARGFRLSTELVAGVLVGAAIGWLLDRWLGISPWGMIVFLLLGFGAGVLNVMRAAGLTQTTKIPPPGAE